MGIKLKLLMAMCLAVVGVTAASASAASASEFNAERYPVSITGSQLNTNVFETSAGAVECSTATFTGTASAKSSTVEITPTYSGCKAFGFVSATVSFNGCKYLFHAGSGSGGSSTGTVDIVPTGCGPIVIKAFTCEVKVGSQSGLSSVGYKTLGSGSGREIEVNAAVTGITYTASSGCPGGAGTKSNGKYTGKAKVKGTNGGTADGLFITP